MLSMTHSKQKVKINLNCADNNVLLMCCTFHRERLNRFLIKCACVQNYIEIFPIKLMHENQFMME